MELRKTLDELYVRYQLEPHLNDMYVEGSFDKQVFNSFQSQLADRRVLYEIDTVELQAGELEAHGLSSGNKNRLILLSRELDANCSATKVTCLVDRDCDHWLGQIQGSRTLKWSSFSSIELHFFTHDHLYHLLCEVCGSKIRDFALLFDSIRDTLKWLFAFRLTSMKFEDNLRWVSTRKYLSREGERVLFDEKKYLIAVLNANSLRHRLAAYERSVEIWHKKLEGDSRQSIRGHDLIEIASWVIKNFSGYKGLADVDSFPRLFIAMAPRVDTLAKDLS